MTRLLIESFSETSPGPVWSTLFHRFWPGYKAWFLRDTPSPRPTLAECEAALLRHMPELVETYTRLVDLAGGGQTEARMLSLWRPPAFMSGCSQAVWTRGPGPGPLVRSYEYSPELVEGVVLRTGWTRPVLGMSDCLWGLLDGVNDAGLCVALAFGGRDAIGEGFGIPLVLRYILETCTDTPGACATLSRIPVHMAYNVTMVDAAGGYASVQVGPDRPALVRRDPVSTNHQTEPTPAAPRPGGRPPLGAISRGRGEGAAAGIGQSDFTERYAQLTATHAREGVLRALLADPAMTPERLVERFLTPPLFSSAYHKGWGTLYVASYSPGARSLDLRWRDGTRVEQSIASFTDGAVEARLK